MLILTELYIFCRLPYSNEAIEIVIALSNHSFFYKADILEAGAMEISVAMYVLEFLHNIEICIGEVSDIALNVCSKWFYQGIVEISSDWFLLLSIVLCILFSKQVEQDCNEWLFSEPVWRSRLG